MGDKTYTMNHRGVFPAAYLACGFAAYYLRYGNSWQGNEIRLAYNVLFGTLNLLAWCIGELFMIAAPIIIPLSMIFGAMAAIIFFLWMCRLPPFRGHNNYR